MFYRLFSPLKIAIATIAGVAVGLGGQLYDHTYISTGLFSFAGLLAVVVLIIHFFDVRKHKQVRDKLRDFLLYGTELFDEAGIENQNDYDEWKKDYEAWNKDVKGWLTSTFSYADSIRFHVVTPDMQNLTYRNQFNQQHHGELNQLRVCIAYLADLFDRHQAKTY